MSDQAGLTLIVPADRARAIGEQWAQKYRCRPCDQEQSPCGLSGSSPAVERPRRLVARTCGFAKG